MSPRRRNLRAAARAVWKDGWVGAWLGVTGLNLVTSWLGATPQWLLGAFFGGSIGLGGGYLVTIQRNYRRTSRQNLEWELSRMRQLRMRVIARVGDGEYRAGLLSHLDESERQLHEFIEELT